MVWRALRPMLPPKEHGDQDQDARERIELFPQWRQRVLYVKIGQRFS
jgi:hypothetical protein